MPKLPPIDRRAVLAGTAGALALHPVLFGVDPWDLTGSLLMGGAGG